MMYDVNEIFIMPDVNPADFTENLSAEDEALVEKMFASGLHWGRARARTHPKMKPYIFSSRGEIQVIDLAKTLEGLRAAEEFILATTRKGASILLVGTQPAARQFVAETGERLKLPYVHEKWLGGTLTNMKTILARINYMKDLEKKMHTEEFEKYTKRERSQFMQEYNDMKEKFQGIRDLAVVPGALLLIGIKRHDTALREAKRRGIPVIAMVNTDDDPTQVEWPIPANDNATTSIQFILKRVEEAVEKARLMGAESKEAPVAAQASK